MTRSLEKTLKNQILFRPNPALTGRETQFAEVTVAVPAVLKSWKSSLFAHEWMTEDGAIKPVEALKPADQEKRKTVEQSLRDRAPIEKPVLGIGIMDNVEIGSGRATLLTLAALGIDEVPVHIPASHAREFTPFIVDAKKNQAGAAIFYVLLAIALFAALSVAVMQMGKNSGGNSYSSEYDKLTATEILSQANQYVAAARKLRLRGIAETQISFRNNLNAGFNNLSCTTDACRVFRPDGGGLTPLVPPPNANNGQLWTFTGSSRIVNAGNASDGDLLAILPDINVNVCRRLNYQLGNAQLADTPPVIASMTWNEFIGSYALGFTPTSTNLRAGCVQITTLAGSAAGAMNNKYHFYILLLAR